MVQLVRNPPAMRETWIQSLGWEGPLEKGNATHSSILAWRIPYGVIKSQTWLSDFHLQKFFWFPGGSDSKESACNVGDWTSVPGSGTSPGEGNDNPLQYSCLENPMDRGAWWATAHGVTKSRTWLSDYHFHFLPELFMISTSKLKTRKMKPTLTHVNTWPWLG